MPVPDFIVALRRFVGSAELWIPGVTAVVRKNDQVLIIKRSDNLEWAPVTDILEPGEEAAVGAAREVMEETGVRVRVDRLASTGVLKQVKHVNGDVASYLDLTFSCTWLEHDPYPADDEALEAGWFRLDNLPPMKPVRRERIEAATSGEAAARFSR